MMSDSDDDSDGPVVFKRSSTSKSNQLNTEIKKSSSSQRDDGRSTKQNSEARPSNGQNSGARNGNPTPSKASQVKSSLVSPKVSSSSVRPTPVQSSGMSGKQPSSTAEKSKQSLQQNRTASVKREQSDSDSDDGKPLKSRFPSKTAAGSSVKPNKESNAGSIQLPISKVKDEDSDDGATLSSRFKLKPNAGASTSKSNNCDEKKPLASKSQPNGSVPKDSQIKKSPAVNNKRQLDEAKSSVQHSVKKPKIADSPSSASAKTPLTVKDDEDFVPISQRIKKDSKSPSSSKSLSGKQKVTKVKHSSMKNSKKVKMTVKKSYSTSSTMLPSSGEAQKWTTLSHNGVIFPPPYKPHGVKMLYKGKPVDLTPAQEEVATMFAVMLDTDYMSKPQFKENFINDWRTILGKNHVIQNLEDCDFTPIYEWHQREKEKKKQMTTEEKKALKEEKSLQEEKYTWAVVDGVKEKIGNFRVEPPGLFRGRGEHPKMGKLKKRIRPNDITINIGKEAEIPECPIPGESWKEIRHDNTVTWLAYWNDPINPKEFKYVFLAASSSLKGQSDKEKYEKARLLKDYIQGIRQAYTRDFTSKDVTKRQVAVATYLIDKLALRAGNEKDDDEADTVGCCTLKVENVLPQPPNILKFDFLGKDSIRYQNEVEVVLPVYEAIQKFRSGKTDGDDLFDKLDTSKLNVHLKELMPGLTAKVFRTYNASITLDDMLSKGTKGANVAENVVVYQHANKEVAIICNHQRTVSKSHSAQMTKLNEKIEELKNLIDELKTDLSRAKKGKPPLKDADGKPKRNLNPEALERKIAQTNVKIEKMERDKETKEDLKTVALGTSKINYLDPRITVAWCKRNEVPMEKMFNKSLLGKFAWAMDVDPSFRF
ncbi:DNA topoisomerase 1 alpha-like [Impatiens glandulifera]|uniref:DNA topoisomerase 1 alpha-like n=1 Tax=Impatiens glandulifera TaxID=253017 RepID=UPI001FB0AA15|nr:DNA topoisomerase 1 alpha-like [Impatiens glandulifera]